MSTNRKVVITVEARMGSTRLPGKCDLPVLNTTTTGILIERLKQVRNADGIVLAITVSPRDDVLEDRARQFGVGCFRGSEEDVMSRVIGAGEFAKADLLVEVTGDCLLLDPRLLERGIDLFFKGSVDVVTNVMNGKVSYPQGMDVQVFPLRLLREAWPHASVEQREHVSLYFYQNPQKYRIQFMEAPERQHLPHWRLMLDYEQDYRLLKTVFEKLHLKKKDFGIDDVIQTIQTDSELLKLAEATYDR